MEPPIIRYFFRRVAHQHLLWHRAIPQRQDFEFLWVQCSHTQAASSLGGGVIVLEALTKESSGPFPRMKSAAFCACAAACTISVLSLRNCSSQFWRYAAE